MTPAISVVMPVLNGEKYLRLSIESILNQTYRNFEFIIINDGSTDKTEEIIKSFGDKRIVYINNGLNKGLSASFNIGIRAAHGKYIARMDADDIAYPDRFRRQISFLEKKPDIGIVGTAMRVIDQDGRQKKVIKKPSEHILIKWTSLLSTPLFHPTVMGRTEIFKTYPYDEKLYNSEDYELWSRLLFQTDIKLANLPDTLLFYRIYQNSFTKKLNPARKAASAQNTIKNLEQYITLKNEEKSHILSLLQTNNLSLSQHLILLKMYYRAANSFSSKEKLDLILRMRVYSWIPILITFIVKNLIKAHLRPA